MEVKKKSSLVQDLKGSFRKPVKSVQKTWAYLWWFILIRDVSWCWEILSHASLRLVFISCLVCRCCESAVLFPSSRTRDYCLSKPHSHSPLIKTCFGSVTFVYLHQSDVWKRLNLCCSWTKAIHGFFCQSNSF